jgi:hypothetical protein
MKDFGAAKKIIGMEISRDMKSSLLFLSAFRKSYVVLICRTLSQ